MLKYMSVFCILVLLSIISCGNKIWNRPMFKPVRVTSNEAISVDANGKIPIRSHTYVPKDLNGNDKSGNVKISIGFNGQKIPQSRYAPGYVMLTMIIWVENNSTEQFNVPISTSSIVTSSGNQYDADWKNNAFGETDLRPGAKDSWRIYFDTHDPDILKTIQSFTFYMDFYLGYKKVEIKEKFNRIQWVD